MIASEAPSASMPVAVLTTFEHGCTVEYADRRDLVSDIVLRLNLSIVSVERFDASQKPHCHDL